MKTFIRMILVMWFGMAGTVAAAAAGRSGDEIAAALRGNAQWSLVHDDFASLQAVIKKEVLFKKVRPLLERTMKRIGFVKKYDGSPVLAEALEWCNRYKKDSLRVVNARLRAKAFKIAGISAGAMLAVAGAFVCWNTYRKKVEAARVEAERRAAEERAREERVRMEAARVEAERRAAEERVRMEAARVEAERRAVEERAREERVRMEAARVEAERRAAERRAAQERAEQARRAEQAGRVTFRQQGRQLFSEVAVRYEVGDDFNLENIKKLYRKLALRLHPDKAKLAGLSEQQMEEKFKVLGSFKDWLVAECESRFEVVENKNHATEAARFFPEVRRLFLPSQRK